MQNKQSLSNSLINSIKATFNKLSWKTIVSSSIIAAGIIGSYSYNNLRNELQQIIDLQQQYKIQCDNIISENNKLKQSINVLNDQINELHNQIQSNNQSTPANIQQSSIESSNEYMLISTGYNSMLMEATCYSSEGGSITADGTYVGDLPFEAYIVASNDFPLGTQLYITCDSYPSINGVYTVRDTGGMGYGVIDIWFGAGATYHDMAAFGRRTVRVEVLA